MDDKFYRSSLAEHRGKDSKMDKYSGTPKRFNVEDVSTSTPKDPRNGGRECPRGFDELVRN